MSLVFDQRWGEVWPQSPLDQKGTGLFTAGCWLCSVGDSGGADTVLSAPTSELTRGTSIHWEKIDLGYCEPSG